MISFEDFEKVELRVGTIVAASEFAKAKKTAYQLLIDFGESGQKRSSAQITDLYTPEDLKGRQVIAVINLLPKQIAGFISECLILGIYSENNEVVLLQPERKVENGRKIG